MTQPIVSFKQAVFFNIHVPFALSSISAILASIMLSRIINKVKSLLAAYPFAPALGLFLLGLIVFLVVAINQLGLGNDQESASSPTPTQSESVEISATDTSDDQSD